MFTDNATADRRNNVNFEAYRQLVTKKKKRSSKAKSVA